MTAEKLFRHTPSTAQNKALHDWLASSTNLVSYSDEKKIQHYVLATLFYSTNGDEWYDTTHWLSDNDEYTWYKNADGPFCSNGAVEDLDFYDEPRKSGNNLAGSILAEMTLLSNSLSKFGDTSFWEQVSVTWPHFLLFFAIS